MWSASGWIAVIVKGENFIANRCSKLTVIIIIIGKIGVISRGPLALYCTKQAYKTSYLKTRFYTHTPYRAINYSKSS